MLSPYRNQPRPLELPSGILYFHDWRYMQHGRVGWRAADGGSFPLWTTGELPSLRAGLGGGKDGSWPLESPVEGRFALQLLKTKALRAVVNCKTAPAGSVRAEVLGPDNRPLPGRSFAECDWISGDHLDRSLT